MYSEILNNLIMCNIAEIDKQECIVEETFTLTLLGQISSPPYVLANASFGIQFSVALPPPHPRCIVPRPNAW